MKKALVFLFFTLATAVVFAQTNKKAFEGAVDFLNCKLVELVLSEGDPAVFTAFKASCNCTDNPDYGQILAAIPVRQTKTKRLAQEVQQVKAEKIANKPAAAIAGFLSNKVFDDFAKYPAIYAFATKRIESDGFYELKQQLHIEIAGYLQQKKESSTIVLTDASPTSVATTPVNAVYSPGASETAAVFADKGPGKVKDSIAVTEGSALAGTATAVQNTDVREIEERLALLESSKDAAAGIIDHTTFQMLVLVMLAAIFGWVYWKNKGAPLTRENQEEIKGFIDRKLLTRFGAMQNTNGAGQQWTFPETPLPREDEEENWQKQNPPVQKEEKAVPPVIVSQPEPAGLNLIFTYKNEMILSRQHQDNTLWQEKIEGYKSSVSFEDEAELAEFLELEYNVRGIDARRLGIALEKSKSDFLLLQLDDEGSGPLQWAEFSYNNPT